MKTLLFLAFSAIASAQFSTDSRGIIQTGLPAAQDNLLGPLIPYGASPWPFGDSAARATADNIITLAFATGEAPALGTALSGTVSWTTGTQTITTTADLTAPLSGKNYVIFAWTSVDGAGSGRAMCPIASVTSTTITCSINMFAPTSSLVTAYQMPAAGPSGGDISQVWTPTQPSQSWHYYDVPLGIFRLYYRTGVSSYLTNARQFADYVWQWTLDHGYNYIFPRGESMLSQFFRALDGHPERFPYLYQIVTHAMSGYGQFAQFCPYCDSREAAYALWWAVMGAKTDPDPTRHTAYCSYLTTTVPYWHTVQQSDGSWGEREYALNSGFVDAPKSFVGPPFIFEATAWRGSLTMKMLEAAYESLMDTSAQGCSGAGTATIAANALTDITNFVVWMHDYARDSVGRGTFYEINSQSADQSTVHGTGTVSINVGFAALAGSGTSFITNGWGDGTHFIGIAGPNDPRTVYKIGSCSSNTACTLTVNFGLYGETLNASGVGFDIAPAASTGCPSLASFCFGNVGDRNLTRLECGGIAWLYAQTRKATYLNWSDECVSATLGGPTAGLTSAANEGAITLPCSGPACDGHVNDTWDGAPNCGATVPVNTAPCLYGNTPFSHLGKNYGEAFGAPGLDNALAWRLWKLDIPISGKAVVSGKAVN